jgi:hypothetical protein
MGDNAIKKTEAYKWVTSFSERRACITDKERLGRPPTSKTEEILEKFVKLCVKIVS